MGIGLFVALIGLVKAGFVGAGPEFGPPVQLGAVGELAGWPVLLFCVTLLSIFMLQARKVPGAILIGIVGGTVLAAILNAIVDIDPKAWKNGPPSSPAPRSRCPTSRCSARSSSAAGATSAS